ncbi:hypothetical protein HanRHA438_Chr17g0825321 [Helianthus annuus]|nr:hypothetical protein HanRHA438_Chr17g0825321 [Helianthus annuus]
MNSLNIIVDFSTYMYFRELKDLARYGTFSRCTSFQDHPGFRECDSFLDKSQSLNCVYVVFKLYCLLNKVMVVRVFPVKTMLWYIWF